MKGVSEENPTRRSIITLLKKHGGMSIDQLSKALGITSMGVRQHLLSLEGKGLVRYETERKGVGRPGYVYRLTEEAQGLFPTDYQSFLLDLLEEIESRDGRKKIEDIFRWRNRKLLEDRKSRLGNLNGLSRKIRRFSDILAEDGYLVELEEKGKMFCLKQYNCPIATVSRRYPESCRFELEMYRELFGKGVVRTDCISQGAPACIYQIPARGK